VPTPFYHLKIAEELFGHPDLSNAARSFLSQNRAAFLFGNTAPDVQVLSGQPREETHFFDLPIRPGDPPAWDRFLLAYPTFTSLNFLPADQAAFLAGYLCHLQADWLWVVQIFEPVFGPVCGWSSFSHRLYLHNVLRAYLDQGILPYLSPGLAQQLSTAEPTGWLPFVRDIHLRAWRDLLAQQLQPGAVVQTVEVFAARQGISPQAYYSLLTSEEKMDAEVFARLPREDLDLYRKQLIEENIRLLKGYLVVDICRY
jgi:Zinc dependent phospholipase C